METITDIGTTIGEKIVDFMDSVPGFISSIPTLVIVAGLWFLG